MAGVGEAGEEPWRRENRRTWIEVVGEWVAGGVAIAALKAVVVDVVVAELSHISEAEVYESNFLAV